MERLIFVPVKTEGIAREFVNVCEKIEVNRPVLQSKKNSTFFMIS